MPDAATLQAARDVGGWVFATVVIMLGSAAVVRWLMGLLDKQVAATERVTASNEKLADLVEALIAEVRAQRRGR